MERIEVIARAAAAMRARHPAGEGRADGAGLTERVCDALEIELRAAPAGDVMLGGAYSRLQLWGWDRPELGGMIWLRADLDPAMRAFAIAHELGHYALHRGEGIGLHPPCDAHQVDQRADPGELRAEDRRVEEYTPRARRELEANAFAAELLAPRGEVRRRFLGDIHADAGAIARHFGIAPVLARRRLVDAVLCAGRPRTERPSPQVAAPELTVPGEAERGAALAALLGGLDESQREAARAPGPALVVAGPGTGKTATLVGRAAHLVGERDVPPEQILALTFSNRAAGEMRERLTHAGLPGERMAVMTIHAFAADLLRAYPGRVPRGPHDAALRPDFRIVDETDGFLLLEELLGTLQLRFYRSLGNPTSRLPTLLRDFSRARDALLTPAQYLALVDAMPPRPEAPETPELEDAQAGVADGGQGVADGRRHGRAHGGAPRPEPVGYTPEQIGRARERALAYGVWDRELRRRGLVDFGGLIQRAVELLRADEVVLTEVRARYPELLVDEFQDTNHAAGELLMLVAGEAGRGLWVVGDRRQSIHRWRGASPANLARLVERYPRLHVRTLRRCYRSVPAIVRTGAAMAGRMDELAAPATATPEGGPGGPAMPPLLLEALRPVELEAVRPAGPHPALLRAEAMASGAQERGGVARSIRRLRERGFAFRDQAVLCRTHKQVTATAAALAAAGIPVAQPGGFFQRPEVRDGLALLALAAGPDARGLLRAPPLLVGLGCPVPPPGELAAVVRGLGAARRPVPHALRRADALSEAGARTPGTRTALATLGEVAEELRYGGQVGEGLARFLLRPGGYAWRLGRVAEGLDAPADVAAGTSGDTALGGMVALRSRAAASTALGALGELVRVAARFDVRWAREDDFRARLGRAVRRRRTAPEGDGGDTGDQRERAAPEADARELPPAADVGAAAPATVGGDVAPGADEASAPAVRCFLHYLDALRGAEAPIEVPAADEDAVQVLTLHRSKGLEFPVVYLPGLAAGQFPPGGPGHEDPCPPGFREGDAPGEREAEERCLFYVGATRARDVLVVTRALSYGVTSSGAPRRAEASPLLALLDGAPDWRAALPLATDGEPDALAAAEGADETDDEADEEEPASAAAPVLGAEKRVYPFQVLDQYLVCPLRYRYAQHYGLLDPAGDAVHRFHRYVRRGMRDLRELRDAAPQAGWERAEAHLRAGWQEVGPAGHAYEAFFWQHARAILRGEWQALTADETSSLARATALAQRLRAELRRCIVEVTADRVIEDDAGVTLVRLHTGRPSKQDGDDLRLPLYYLAYMQQHPELPVRVALAYVGDGLAGDSPPAPNPGASQAGGLVDVTDAVRRAAERYTQPDRRHVSALDKLDRAAAGIEAGRFAPRPRERECAACAYHSVCPADPAEAATAIARPLPGGERGIRAGD